MTSALITWRGPRFLGVNGPLTSRGAFIAPGEKQGSSAQRTHHLPAGFALPGFIDSHAHLALPGHRPDELELPTHATRAHVRDTLQECARGRRPGTWITGGGWQHITGEAPLPHHTTLSDACPDHPVALRRYDEHALWVNKRALEAAGIQANTPVPAGGRILRDAAGEPLGTLVDAAMELVEGIIPPPSDDEVRRLIRKSAELFLSLGVTCVHDMAVSARTLHALHALDAASNLDLRVRAYLYAADPELAGHLAERAQNPGPERLGVRGLKLFSDGALGSCGARLSVAYPDGSRGVQPDSDLHMERTIEHARAGGWQLAVHAIGDAAVRDTVERLKRASPGAGARWRIEHAQLLGPGTARAMKEAGLVAAVQPVHATHDLPWARDLLPPSILARAYPWRTLLEHGIPMGLGTDYPIEPADPRATLLAACLRQSETGQALPGQGERLTRRQACEAHWRGSAFLAFDERWLGRLLPGFLCDFVVWDQDLLSAPPDVVKEARVLATVVGGRVCYEA